MEEVNVLVLAFLGDAIYEEYVRRFLVKGSSAKVNDLQTLTIKYVSAKGQAHYLKEFLDSNYLTPNEVSVVMRARNYKTTSHPRNCDIITYKYATGLEALIGYLDLTNNKGRIDEIMGKILC